MANKYQFRTIDEMERYFYGTGLAEIQKDAPVLSSTTAVYQAVYGKKVWSWLNEEANIFGVLPKKPWTQSGWRVATTRPAASGGGVAENGSIPATTKYTFAALTTNPKLIAHTFDVSEVAQALAKSDDAISDMAIMRKMTGIHHAEMMNIMLLTQSGTPASNNLESIDRVTATYAEDTTCTENDGSTAFTAGDNDIYSQDRDAATTADSNCLENDNTTRSLTLTLLDQADELVLTNGPAVPGQKVWVTGYDTLRVWAALLQSQQRFMEVDFVKLGANGVQTVPGRQAGFRVNSYMGYPIIPSKNVVTDTTGSAEGISRVYLLDLGYIELRVAKPTQYFEVGISSGDPWGPTIIGDEGMYRTMGELICTDFKAHCKIRDLKA
jgi:hypothetical protein